jgi:Zn-dependent protease
MSTDLGPSRVRIRARPGWYLLAALVTVGLATRYFPVAHPMLTPGAHWGMAVAGVILLADSILLHELAHTWVAARHGVASRGVTFAIFGGQAELARALPTPAADALLALAGPAANVLLAAIAWALLAIGDGRWSELVLGVLAFAAHVNVLLAIFNLLPVLPLDGGRVVRALAWWRTGSATRATVVAARVGVAACVLLAAFAVFLLVRRDVGNGLLAALAALYLWRRARGFLSSPPSPVP